FHAPGGNPMLRNAALLFAGLALAWQAVPARAADDALIGTWQSDHDGYHEIWTIAKDKDDYAVNGVFKQNGNEVGSFNGGDVKVADGKLTCTQKYVQKPDASWADGTKMTAPTSNDKLDFTWDNGNGQSGTREMTKVGK